MLKSRKNSFGDPIDNYFKKIYNYIHEHLFVFVNK